MKEEESMWLLNFGQNRPSDLAEACTSCTLKELTMAGRSGDIALTAAQLPLQA